MLLSASPANLWRKLNRTDRVALGFAVLLIFLRALSALGREAPLLNFLSVFCYFALASYAVLRLVTWVRRRKLWSIRNRLVVAYLFIAVVPLFLLGAMAGLSAYLIYQQFAAYLVYRDVQAKLDRLEAIAHAPFAAYLPQAGTTASRGIPAGEAPPTNRAILESIEKEFPGIRWNAVDARVLLARSEDVARSRFVGLVQQDQRVWLMVALRSGQSDRREPFSLGVPFDEKLLEHIMPELGPIQVTITRPARIDDDPLKVRTLGEVRFVTLEQFSTRGRALPARAGWFDTSVTGLSKLEAVSLSGAGEMGEKNVLFASVTSRPSILNQWLFRVPGDVGSIYARGLLAIGILFLMLEAAALITGINLSRSITGAVDDLYKATQHVKEGDFSYRVRVARNDQLGALGESFNAMTGSITDLIEEQRQRQRLENELSIAREVQAQLFPQEFPRIPGVELYASCRAARMVSGDYYDFIQLAPQRVAIAIADISGKGISAALLMASLQGALRSQLQLNPALASDTAELVSRLNLHLFLNTSSDRYATLFFAIYDSGTRTLTYTNAGHLPPLLVTRDKVLKLEEGGMVVGLFDEFSYERGTIQVEPGSLFVAYSDGVTEPENAYGEQFGQRRLADEVLRHRANSPQRLVELLFSAAEEWGGAPGQADDMTVVVARIS